MGLVNIFTLFLAGFNLGQLNYEKVYQLHPISCPFFMAQIGTIAYVFSLQLKEQGIIGVPKYLFSVIGNIGDFFCVTAYMYCYINRVLTFMKNTERWLWVRYIPFYYLVVAITESLVDLNIVVRQPNFIYIYSGAAIAVSLTNLTTHFTFSYIIYQDLLDYPLVKYICVFTLASVLAHTTLVSLTFIGYINFEPVYLCGIIDTLIFLLSNRVILKTVQNTPSYIKVQKTDKSTSVITQSVTTLETSIDIDSIQVTPRPSYTMHS
ncbi:hypothetical protein HDV06_006140 [Boothiomyces sp. JEL0866]|nr:hypothetical protein HDV06_006140 [Boothiomyces sp. JEL0866]